MGSEGEDASPVLKSIWGRIMFNVRPTKDSADAPVADDAVGQQTEISRKSGTIWEAVLKADEAAMKRLLQENPKYADQRGPVGECPIHMLFLYGSEAHLQMAQYVITNFPHTITQIYNEAVKNNCFSCCYVIEKFFILSFCLFLGILW